MTRAGDAAVNCPKFDGELASNVMLIKFTLFSALKASARNCSRWPSCGNRNTFEIAKSVLIKSSSRTAPRVPTSPGSIGFQLAASLTVEKMLGLPNSLKPTFASYGPVAYAIVLNEKFVGHSPLWAPAVDNPARYRTIVEPCQPPAI